MISENVQMARSPTRPKIMASVLTADFSALGEQCRELQDAGVDGIHWDLMDGVVVPSLSFGPDVIAACRKHVTMPFEAHVMTSLPDRLIEHLAGSGCESMTIHPDWVQNPRRTLQSIVDSGMSAGVALSPGTSVDHARWYIDIIDLVLVMTVEPGFGGQAHIGLMTEKISEVAALVKTCGRPIEIEVDGGIGPETIEGAFRAGAGKAVIGSALWRARSFAAAVEVLGEAVGYPDAK
jgi:ribulose-phosphate 3-epimerase